MQISTLFSKFQADGDAMKPALVRASPSAGRSTSNHLTDTAFLVRGAAWAANQSVNQLEELLPAFKKRKIEILLDALVSRRLLRPFVVEGTMFWQAPA